MTGPLVSDASLASVRATFDRDLVDRGEILRVSGEQNTALGHEVTRTSQGVQPCKYGPPGRLTQNTAERIVIGGVEVVVQAMLKMKANTVVQQEDRIIVTLEETGESIPLDVTYVRKKTREFRRKVLCKFATQDSDID